MSEFKDKTTQIENDVCTENKPGVKHLFRLWKYVFSSAKAMCVIFMGLTILLSLLRPILAFIWSAYVDSVNGFMDRSNFFSVFSLALTYYIIGFIADLILRYTDSKNDIERFDIIQANRFKEMLDSKVYKKISTISVEHTDIPKINDIIARVFGFTSDAWRGLSQTIMRPGYFVVAKLLSVVSIAASLYIINPWLCFVLIVAPIPTLYTAYVGNKLQFNFVKENVELKREMEYFQGLMLGGAVKEIKVLTLFDFFYAKWKTRVDEYAIKENKTYLKRMALGTIANIVSSLASVSANILAIVLLTLGRISLGALGAVMSLIGTLIEDVSALFSSLSIFLSKKHEAGMFFDLIDLPSEKLDGESVKEVNEIATRDLSYRYPLSSRYVLKNISLSIRRGEKIAFVGENGAGKTTFIKLISGLIGPSSGELFINGIDGSLINSFSRFDTLSAVTQEPARYTTFTVSDNVFIGDTTNVRNEVAVEKAIQFSGIENVTSDALLGKDIGGTELSGGQWQKIAIARGYYRDRDFIILDEPTGNLDPIAEAEVFKKYMMLMQDKTVIVVTHRISAASLADRIVVFKDGMIVEDGSHDCLLAAKGEYARLYMTQAQLYNR